MIAFAETADYRNRLTQPNLSNTSDDVCIQLPGPHSFSFLNLPPIHPEVSNHLAPWCLPPFLNSYPNLTLIMPEHIARMAYQYQEALCFTDTDSTVENIVRRIRNNAVLRVKSELNPTRTRRVALGVLLWSLRSRVQHGHCTQNAQPLLRFCSTPTVCQPLSTVTLCVQLPQP